jgi:hypothetical protein
VENRANSLHSRAIAWWAERLGNAERRVGEKVIKIKKKTAVPVVQRGKVERLPKWLMERRLARGAVFQIQAV